MSPRASEVHILPGNPLERPTLSTSAETNKAVRSSDHFYARAENHHSQNFNLPAKLLETPKGRSSANYSARAEGKILDCLVKVTNSSFKDITQQIVLQFQ